MWTIFIVKKRSITRGEGRHDPRPEAGKIDGTVFVKTERKRKKGLTAIGDAVSLTPAY